MENTYIKIFTREKERSDKFEVIVNKHRHNYYRRTYSRNQKRSDIGNTCIALFIKQGISSINLYKSVGYII